MNADLRRFRGSIAFDLGHRTIAVEPQRHGDTEGHRDIAEEKPQIAQIDADRPHRIVAPSQFWTRMNADLRRFRGSIAFDLSHRSHHNVASTKTPRHEGIAGEPQRHGDTEGHRDIAEEKPQIAQIDADKLIAPSQAIRTAESAPVSDRRHRDGVCPIRTPAFGSATHRPGPSRQWHDGSALAMPGLHFLFLGREECGAGVPPAFG